MTMIRKIFTTPVFILLIFVLSACSSAQIPGVSALSSQNPNTAAQQVNNKLGYGILALEGTKLAVTDTQAKDLLFLWQGVKAVNSEPSAAPAEIAAVYDQIKGDLTPEQVQAIQNMNVTTATVNNLMSQYNLVNNIAATSGGTKAGSTTSNFAAAGGNSLGGLGGDPTLGGGTGSTTISTTRTTKSAQSAGGSKPGNTNTIFADAVIKLLTGKLKSV
jgi:hypothetical protein